MSGTTESTTMVADMAAVRDTLQRGGVPATNLNFNTRPDGQHAEWFWRREFGPAYQWLFGATAPTATVGGQGLGFQLYPSPGSGALWVQLPPRCHHGPPATGRCSGPARAANERGPRPARGRARPGPGPVFLASQQRWAGGARQAGAGVTPSFRWSRMLPQNFMHRLPRQHMAPSERWSYRNRAVSASARMPACKSASSAPNTW